jgi:hypothetical protein
LRIHRESAPDTGDGRAATANITLEERRFVKIGDLRSSRFGDMMAMMTPGVGTPLSMAAKMYPARDYTGAVHVYSFAFIVDKVLVGEPVIPATMTLPVLFKIVSKSERPELPARMLSTVRQIIEQGGSLDPDFRDSLDVISEALRRIGFKITPAVDTKRVVE